MGYIEMADVLKALPRALPITVGSIVDKHRSMERQLWRLQDLSDGGAFGFTLELYLISLRRILSTTTSHPGDNLITFYTGALKAITSDWDQHKGSLGTVQIILNIVCDIAVRDRGIFSNWSYPAFVEEELLKLLGKMIGGYIEIIDSMILELQDGDVEWRIRDRNFYRKVIDTMQDHRGS